tara:strand:+ start:550 stop:852 length:303 start_codon:yes stop_codon:yes gene_type:complete
MNPRRRLAFKLKARAAQVTPSTEVITEQAVDTAEEASAKILPSYNGKAETVIAETTTETPQSAETTAKPTAKAKTAKTIKAKKATSTPKTRKTKTAKKTS